MGIFGGFSLRNVRGRGFCGEIKCGKVGERAIYAYETGLDVFTGIPLGEKSDGEVFFEQLFFKVWW